MRTIKYLFILIGLSLGLDAQTIRRVNGTPGVSGVNVYATPQEAHDASVDGDIIYIEPTQTDNTTYGNLTINRRVTVIGKGYDLDRVTGSSFDKRTVDFSNIYLEQGSAGSRITGLVVNSITIYDANCVIDRNRISAISLSLLEREGVQTAAKNTIIRNNRIIFIGGNGNESGLPLWARSTGAIISNNIIIQNGYIMGVISATIERNTFKDVYGYVFNDVDGSNVINNIFDARDVSSFFATLPNCHETTVSNNLCIRHAGLPAGNGNVNSVSSSTVFKVANPWTVSPFLESNLELAANSPARTVGPGGTPIGAFSGTNPFIPSGLTNVPIITDFTLNGIGNTNSPLQVTIKARSNN